MDIVLSLESFRDALTRQWRVGILLRIASKPSVWVILEPTQWSIHEGQLLVTWEGKTGPVALTIIERAVRLPDELPVHMVTPKIRQEHFVMVTLVGQRLGFIGRIQGVTNDDHGMPREITLLRPWGEKMSLGLNRIVGVEDANPNRAAA